MIRPNLFYRVAVISTLVILFFFNAMFSDAAARNMIISETDFKGHRLTMDQVPERIACLYAFAGHVVTMLGRGQDMVAVVRGLKRDRLLNRLLPGLKITAVPSAGGIIHVETLLRSAPDIVFLKPETAGIEAEIKKLERFNLPWLTAGYHDMAGQMAVIEMMGRVLDRAQKARAYTRYYRRVIDRVRQRTGGLEEDRRIRLYHSINEPFRTDGAGTLEADWTAVCNVVNVSVGTRLKSRKNKHFAGMEQILLWNPEMIIANEAAVARKIMTDKKWAPVRAVRDNRVYPVPVGISRWGHPGGLETPLAILWTAKTAYPELFRDIDLAGEMTDFYSRFFSLDLTPAAVDQILSGRGMRLRPQDTKPN